MQVISEKSKDNLQITSEKAVMEVNNEVIISESITFDKQIFLDETNYTIYNILDIGHV